MSDVLLTIRLPEELAAKAKAANVEIESFLIDSLARKFRDDVTSSIRSHPRNPMPTREEVEAEILKSEKRFASGEASQRVLGLHTGHIWMSDDFDDELPDEEWGDLFV